MLKKSSFSEKRKGQEGMAIMEMIPIMIVIILLVNFSIGFFGVIHTGILNSIAARNYAFETFRHRSNLTYFTTNSRDNTDSIASYEFAQERLHLTLSEFAVGKGGQDSYATARAIDFFEFGQRQADEAGSKGDHKDKVYNVMDGKRYEEDGVNPVWIKSAYGICLSTPCGDN